ncbi:MAG: phospholipase D family protein [Myxococcales bacterium]|nr:phospholipase D family protein [Myxococcales bacterium]
MQDLTARPVPLRVVADREHYDQVMSAALEARQSVWIATANLKDVMVEDPRAIPGRRRGRRGSYRSVLDVFAELASQGVELRLLHAAPPSRAFRRSFDARPELVDGGLEMRTCPRVHLKTVVVDARLAYLGSANWTGAGLGAKGGNRRNFEMGILTSDEQTIDQVQDRYDRIWRGAECKDCRLRDECEMPLDQI